MSAPIGVLLMAYGGPDSLAEVPGYLADIRTGRPTPRSVVDEITEHYRLIGGCSPLKAISGRQLAALSAALGPQEYRCYLGMRHWSPWIEEVIGAMAEEGIERAVGVILAPHYSTLNTERYFQKVRDGLELYRSSMELTFVKSYHTAPPLVEALSRRVAEGIARWPAAECSARPYDRWEPSPEARAPDFPSACAWRAAEEAPWTWPPARAYSGRPWGRRERPPRRWCPPRSG